MKGSDWLVLGGLGLGALLLLRGRPSPEDAFNGSASGAPEGLAVLDGGALGGGSYAPVEPPATFTAGLPPGNSIPPPPPPLPQEQPSYLAKLGGAVVDPYTVAFLGGSYLLGRGASRGTGGPKYAPVEPTARFGNVVRYAAAVSTGVAVGGAAVSVLNETGALGQVERASSYIASNTTPGQQKYLKTAALPLSLPGAFITGVFAPQRGGIASNAATAVRGTFLGRIFGVK